MVILSRINNRSGYVPVYSNSHFKLFNMRKLVLTFVACLFSLFVFSQNKTVDVVYLKNGSILRGDIVEQVIGQSLKIKTLDGNVWVFKSEDVDRVVKEEVVQTKVTQEQVIVEPAPAYPPQRQSNYQGYYTSRKDPVLACILSVLVPGVGQIYNGQVGKGIGMMAGTYGALLLAAVSVGDSYGDYYNNSYSSSNSNYQLAGISLLAMVGFYVWSIVDAPLSASRINRQNGVVDINFKNSRLWLNPSVDCLRAQNGRYIPQTTNAGLKLTYSFGSR